VENIPSKLKLSSIVLPFMLARVVHFNRITWRHSGWCILLWFRWCKLKVVEQGWTVPMGLLAQKMLASLLVLSEFPLYRTRFLDAESLFCMKSKFSLNNMRLLGRSSSNALSSSQSLKSSRPSMHCWFISVSGIRAYWRGWGIIHSHLG
jgi:hypothetical protein